MAVDVKKLRELAEKATPGPWQNRSTLQPGDPPRLVIFRSRPEPGWSQQAVATTHVDQPAVKMDQAYEDAAFIAACDPQTVIALLDDNAQLRAACTTWQDYFTGTPGLAAANAEIVSLRSQLAAAQVAARAFVACVDDLGAFADDSDPRVMATAGPISAAQADLWTALGLDHAEEHARLLADIDSRCAVCGWALHGGRLDGCVRGCCSMRPRPEKLYAPERAAREEAELRKVGA